MSVKFVNPQTVCTLHLESHGHTVVRCQQTAQTRSTRDARFTESVTSSTAEHAYLWFRTMHLACARLSWLPRQDCKVCTAVAAIAAAASMRALHALGGWSHQPTTATLTMQDHVSARCEVALSTQIRRAGGSARACRPSRQPDHAWQLHPTPNASTRPLPPFHRTGPASALRNPRDSAVATESIMPRRANAVCLRWRAEANGLPTQTLSKSAVSRGRSAGVGGMCAHRQRHQAVAQASSIGPPLRGLASLRSELLRATCPANDDAGAA